MGNTKFEEQIKSEKDNKKDMFIENLTDLRKELIKSALVFLMFFVAVLCTISIWLPYALRGHNLIVLGPLEVIKFYTSISFFMSLGLSLPFLAYFIWRFVKPGLYERETKAMGLYAPAMFILFISGVGFGYFIVNPLSYNFLISLGALNFDVLVSAEEYMRFLIMTTLPLGLLFEMPVVVLFLASINILTEEMMKKGRKWSYISIAIISGLITPPDFISQLLVLIPMVALYEASIFIIKTMEKRWKLNTN